MSCGEQERVAIVRALINSPRLLLADEPTGNLDSRSATGVPDLLVRMRHENQMTFIVAAHYPQIAARCDRLIRLRDGAIIDDIEITDGQPADETIRRVGQPGRAPASRSGVLSQQPSRVGRRGQQQRHDEVRDGQYRFRLQHRCGASFSRVVRCRRKAEGKAGTQAEG
jgi:ABC-type multidrug transport system ATPase subunit